MVGWTKKNRSSLALALDEPGDGPKNLDGPRTGRIPPRKKIAILGVMRHPLEWKEFGMCVAGLPTSGSTAIRICCQILTSLLRDMIQDAFVQYSDVS